MPVLIYRKWLNIAFLLIFLIGGLSISGCVPQGSQPKGWSGAVISGNQIYLGSMAGELVAMDATSGARLWIVRVAGPAQSGGGCAAPSASVAIYGAPAVGNGIIYVGGYVQSGDISQGKVYAFVSGQEEPRWVYPRDGYLAGPVVGGLVVSGDKVYFGAADGKVYALDAVDGHKIAEYQTGNKIWSTPAIANGVLYISSFDKKLYALDATTLAPTGWKQFETTGAIVATPLVHQSIVYIGSFDRYLYAIDIASGESKWKFLANNWFWAQPLPYGNVIYAPNLDHNVYILNADTGRDVASPIDLGGPISSSPVLADGKIIIASEEGKLYSLDPATNRVSQLAELNENVYAPLSVSGATIYVHTSSDSLYTVDSKSGATRKFLFR